MKLDNERGCTHHLTRIVAIAGLGGLLFGFDTGIIADVQHQLVPKYQLSVWQWSLIVSITVLAAFVGALSSGRLADSLGRRKSLMVVAVGFIFSTLFLTLATGFVSLFVGRLFIGLCIGMASYITPLYIAEIAPKEYRGKLVLFNSIAITLGECLAFLAGYLLWRLNDDSWRLLFFLGVLPAMLLLVGLVRMPASPRWLAMKGQWAKCLLMLSTIRQEGAVRQEWREIKASLSGPCNKSFNTLFEKPLKPVLLLGMTLGILQQFAGINTVMYFGPHLFLSSGVVNADFAIGATFLLGLVNTLATVLVVFIVDKVGRRQLLLSGTILSAVCLMVIAKTFGQQTGAFMVVVMMMYIFFYAISLGSMFWLLISEIYPAAIRSQAMSVVAAIQWLANFIIALVFLPLQKVLPHEGDVFYVFSIMCCVAFFVSYFFVPETKGVSLETIEKNVNQGFKLKHIGNPGG